MYFILSNYLHSTLTYMYDIWLGQILRQALVKKWKFLVGVTVAFSWIIAFEWYRSRTQRISRIILPNGHQWRVAPGPPAPPHPYKSNGLRHVKGYMDTFYNFYIYIRALCRGAAQTYSTVQKQQTGCSTSNQVRQSTCVLCIWQPVAKNESFSYRSSCRSKRFLLYMSTLL